VTTAHVNRAKQRIAEQITGHVDATVYNDPRGSRILAHPGSSVLRGDARRKRTGRPHKFLPRLFPQPSTLWMARSARQGTQIAAVGRRAATLPCASNAQKLVSRVALDPVPARTILVASVPASPRVSARISTPVSVAGVAGSWRHFHGAIASVKQIGLACRRASQLDSGRPEAHKPTSSAEVAFHHAKRQ